MNTHREWNFCAFFKSTIGKKYMMGLAGLVWTGFVFAHMAGNMLIFISPDAYNSYGHALTSGGIIYFAEAILILALLMHVGLAVNLTIKNKMARPQQYAVTAKGTKAANLASRTMAIQGSLILLFIITHIATFKYGNYYETTVDGVVMRDLHRLIVEVFNKPEFVAWYILALVILGFHLRHGFGSVFQSFGLLTEQYAPAIKKASIAYALVVAGGFISQPIYVWLLN
jgi:succinate dehydrogenase / fumarate reductase cytochrome b subunit